MKKKFFSLLLVAAGLLCSGMVWAAGDVARVGTTGYATLEEAFVAENSGKTIVLLQNYSQSQCIKLHSGWNFTLDLNGHTLDFTANSNDTKKEAWNFLMQNAKLNVIGEGSILNKTVNEGSYKTKVLNSKNQLVAGSEIIVFKLWGSDDPNVSDYTVLSIGEDVTVGCTQGKVAVNIDKNTTITTAPYVKAATYAFGVKAYVYGTAYGQKYGMQISGNVKRPADSYLANVPYLYVGPNAEVYSQKNETESVGVYAAGYGIVKIEGYVHAATGIYAKSGDITIDGAHIVSDWEGSYEDPEGKRSGVEAGGSAIVVESNASYPGDINVTITGDTQVEGASGFAIDERITTATTTTVSSISIESGSFETNGENATIYITQETADGVSIDGGSFSDDAVTELGLTTPGTVILTTTDENGNEVFVITKTDSETTPEFVEDKDLNTSVATDYVTVANGDQTVNAANAKAAYLVVEAGNTVTIASGAKLTVGQIVINYIPANPGVSEAVYGKIIVEAGAQLIVTGAQGVYSPKAECLVLKADATSHALFVFNPDTKGNKSPWATVEYYTTAHKRPVGYKFDMFCFPFVKGSVYSVEKTASIGTNYQHIVNGAWKNFANQDAFMAEAEPFEAIAFTNNGTQDNVTYSFKGQLQGNISGKLSLKRGFNYIGNPYMAPMVASEIIKSAPAAVNKYISMWNGTGYTSYNNAFVDDAPVLNAMNMFVIWADADVEAQFDYKKLVWDNIVK